MALGILIAQLRKTEIPAGYFEGLRSFGCVARAEEWGCDLFSHLDRWSPDVIVLQHNRADQDPRPYFDLLRQHPATTHATVGLAACTGSRILPGAVAPQLFLTQDEMNDYLRFFACIKRQLDLVRPILLTSPLVCGDLVFDPRERTVQTSTQTVRLSAREFSLLEYLARRPGRTFSRCQLVSALWADQHDPDQRTVDVLVMRVRKTLSRLGAQSMIRTVHTIGYQLIPRTPHSMQIETMGPIARAQSSAATSPWSSFAALSA